ncbi:hypothetical protein KJA16_02490 [Patescibacteria group bacterium]|nr:hypothetical protein [Patescibacteria group bacterium]
MTYDSEHSFGGIRIPLGSLDDVIKGLQEITNGNNFETEIIAVKFFKDSTEYFYVELRKPQIHHSWHIDNAKAILKALKEFKETKQEQIVALPHP